MRDHIYNQTIKHRVCDIDKIESWLNKLYKWMFINSNCISFSEFLIKEKELEKELEHLVLGLLNTQRATGISLRFFSEIDSIYQSLESDIKAYLSSDLDFNSRVSVIVSSPGFFAVFAYRVSYVFSQLDFSVLSQVCSGYARKLTGIDICYKAVIARGFIIDGGIGVIIRENVKINHNVRISSGVILGGIFSNKQESVIVDHNVIIKNNVSIQTQNITIGAYSVIEQNQIIKQSVKPHFCIEV